MDNPKLRRAMSLAIDRQALVDYVARASQVPDAGSGSPDKLADYDGFESAPSSIPRRLAELRKEAGYADGADVPPITFDLQHVRGTQADCRGPFSKCGRRSSAFV